MYGHFTFFLKKIIISKAQARSKNWWGKKNNKKGTIEESDKKKMPKIM